MIQNLSEQNRLKRTGWLFAEAPPTASSMVPVSARVLNDKLISVSTPRDRPPNSMYPGLEKLTVYRFCKTEMKPLQMIFILAYILVLNFYRTHEWKSKKQEYWENLNDQSYVSGLTFHWCFSHVKVFLIKQTTFRGVLFYKTYELCHFSLLWLWLPSGNTHIYTPAHKHLAL